jgi:hypothetical protein
VNSAINANSDIAKEETLLNQQGSQVKLGNVITVPINQSLIYVQPLYVQAQSNPVPRLADVIVVYHGQAFHGGSLNAALCQLPFGAVFCTLPGGDLPPPSQQTTNTTSPSTGTSPTTLPSSGSSTTTAPSTSPTTAPPANATIAQLLAAAQAHFANAQAALRNGDLALYQSENQAGVADVQQAAKLAGVASAGTTGSASTTTIGPATSSSTTPTTTSTSTTRGP